MVVVDPGIALDVACSYVFLADNDDLVIVCISEMVVVAPGIAFDAASSHEIFGNFS